jgi:hypothetical protein
MRPRAIISTLAGLAVLLALAASPAAAGVGTGCPAWQNPGGNPGQREGELLPVDAAVARTMETLTDGWFEAVGMTREQVQADRTALVIATDKNGDGLVCLAVIWGTELNPNAHWATFWGDLLDPPEATSFLALDNHMGTAKR